MKGVACGEGLKRFWEALGATAGDDDGVGVGERGGKDEEEGVREHGESQLAEHSTPMLKQ